MDIQFPQPLKPKLNKAQINMLFGSVYTALMEQCEHIKSYIPKEQLETDVFKIGRLQGVLTKAFIEHQLGQEIQLQNGVARKLSQFEIELREDTIRSQADELAALIGKDRARDFIRDFGYNINSAIEQVVQQRTQR